MLSSAPNTRTTHHARAAQVIYHLAGVRAHEDNVRARVAVRTELPRDDEPVSGNEGQHNTAWALGMWLCNRGKRGCREGGPSRGVPLLTACRRRCYPTGAQCHRSSRLLSPAAAPPAPPPGGGAQPAESPTPTSSCVSRPRGARARPGAPQQPPQARMNGGRLRPRPQGKGRAVHAAKAHVPFLPLPCVCVFVRPQVGLCR